MIALNSVFRQSLCVNKALTSHLGGDLYQKSLWK